MKKHNRLQNQPLSCWPLSPLTSDSTQTNNHDGGSDTDKSQSTIKKSTSQTIIAAKPTCNEVAALAFQIYLREGRPQGRDLQHWSEAEAQLAAVPPMTIKTEVTVKTETTVKNEVGPLTKPNKSYALLTA